MGILPTKYDKDYSTVQRIEVVKCSQIVGVSEKIRLVHLGNLTGQTAVSERLDDMKN